MATTPNYAWTTPDDTNLVKNGASDIRTLANAIDSTVDGIDTRLGVVEGDYLTSTSGIAKTVIDAKGDLLAGTGADTIARLPVGTNGQVLTADSAETTGMKWSKVSAGVSLLSDTVLSSATATVTISSIPATYAHLVLVIHGRSTNTSGANDVVKLTFNNDTASNYRTRSIMGQGTNSFISSTNAAVSYIELGRMTNANSAMTTGWSGTQITIPNYASTTGTKVLSSTPMFYSDSFSDANSGAAWAASGAWLSATAINRIDLSLTGGNFAAGSRFSLYGWTA